MGGSDKRSVLKFRPSYAETMRMFLGRLTRDVASADLPHSCGAE